MTKLPRTLTSNSAEQTEQIGRSLAELISQDSSLPRFIALYGDLGVGKTAFVRGFTSLFAKNARVKSPTFALVNEYKGESVTVFHFDMYRITDEDELYSIGFYDYLNRGGIALVEWSENIEYALPQEYFSVNLATTSAKRPS
jgi:tRNA threonylcarbamoyladenosine biosynthesis protein TsaE